ncbi:MAG TPA: NAD(P)H-dependent oxidoreductase [Catalimonadaceae bacterium]|nr:NAD(P)H-dependent oxidoreductase [Catalimonadaceae bacterium]
MNVLIISTSSTKNSSTKRVATFLSTIFHEQSIANCQVVDFENFDIPSVGKSSLNQSELSAFQARLISAWERASLVIIACPEYNWSVNGEVLTMLEQLGSKKFKHLFDQKVFAMVGVSSGRGGRLPALEIMKITNKLISFLGTLSVVSPKILEAHEVPANLNEKGESNGNSLFDREVLNFVHYSIRVADQWLVKETKF